MKNTLVKEIKAEDVYKIEELASKLVQKYNAKHNTNFYANAPITFVHDEFAPTIFDDLEGQQIFSISYDVDSEGKPYKYDGSFSLPKDVVDFFFTKNAKVLESIDDDMKEIIEQLDLVINALVTGHDEKVNEAFAIQDANEAKYNKNLTNQVNLIKDVLPSDSDYDFQVVYGDEYDQFGSIEVYFKHNLIVNFSNINGFHKWDNNYEDETKEVITKLAKLDFKTIQVEI